MRAFSSGCKSSTRRLELNRRESGLTPDGLGRYERFCLLHTLVSRPCHTRYSGCYRIRWTLQWCSRARQCDGGSVSSGEVRDDGLADSLELCGVVRNADEKGDCLPGCS